MARLDETIAIGQSGHISDHDQIVARLNDEYYDVLNEYAGNIQTAIDAAAAAGGGVVYMGPGTYALGGTGLTIDYANGAGYQGVSLIGAGKDVTTITFTGAHTGLFWGTSEASAGPRVMTGRLADFTIDGPGRTTASSIGIQIRQCLYTRTDNLLVDGAETGYDFDAGGQWCSSGLHLGLRGNHVKYGIRMRSTTDDAHEVTDQTFVKPYMNSGVGSPLLSGSIGYYIERGNTNSFISPSAEAFEVTYQLGRAAVTGQANKNMIFGTRSEVNTSEVANNTPGRIIVGADNTIIATVGEWFDETANQQNVIIGKRAVGSSTYARLIREVGAPGLPTADADNRGTVLFVEAAAGVKDKFVMSMKAADNSYSWVDLSL